MPNLDFHVSTKMGDMSGINKLRDVMKDIEESAKRITNTMAGFNVSSIATPMASGGGSAPVGVAPRPHTNNQGQTIQGPQYNLNTPAGLYQWDTQVFAPVQSMLMGFNRSIGRGNPSIVRQQQKRKIDDSALMDWFTSLNHSMVKNDKDMEQLYSKIFDHYESSGNFLVKEGRDFYQKYGSQLGAPHDIESVQTINKQIPAHKLMGNSTAWNVGMGLGGIAKKHIPFLTAAGATTWGFSQVTQGYQMWKQNSAPVDTLAHSLGVAVKSVEDFRQQIDYAGAKFGQSMQQSAAAATLLTQSFGNIGQAGIAGLTGQTARFSFNNGLTPQQGAQITATSAQLGITSGVGASMSAAQFQNMLTNGATTAGMQGRQGQFMTGFLDVANQVASTNPIIANPNALLGMYTQLNGSGVQGLQGLRGAGILNEFNQNAMGRNPVAQSLVFSAMEKVLGSKKFSSLSPVQLLEAQQSGISGYVPGTHTTIGKALLDKLRHSGMTKDQQVITLAPFFNGNLNQAKAFLDNVPNNFGAYQPSTANAPDARKSLYDQQQIAEQTKNVGQSALGSVLAYPSIAWNSLGVGGQAAVATVGSMYGVKAVGKVGNKIMRGAGQFLKRGASVAAEGAGAAEGAIAGEAAGIAGVAGGLEAAGGLADSTGVGLPVGLLLGLAGLAVAGIGGYYVSQKKTQHQQAVSDHNKQVKDTAFPSTIKSLTIDSLRINRIHIPNVSSAIRDNSGLNGSSGSWLSSMSSSISYTPRAATKPSFWQNVQNDVSSFFGVSSYKTPKNQADFVDQMYPYALQVSKSTGIPAKYLLAQWGYESASGTSEAAIANLNFAGIKPFDQYGPGKDSKYAGFKSLEEFAQADITVLNNSRYATARVDAQNGASAGQVGYDLAKEGYATADPSGYGSGMESLAQQIGAEFERVIGKYMRKMHISGPVIP